MGDGHRDVGAITRSFNINKPNNVAAPKYCLYASNGLELL